MCKAFEDMKEEERAEEIIEGDYEFGLSEKETQECMRKESVIVKK